MLHKFVPPIAVTFFVSVLFIIGCSAQTEDQALSSLRQLSQGGIQPTDDYLASIERRFSGKRAGALARLLHGRIKFENKDFAGAASVLDSDEFARVTKVADYALWFRGQALQQAGSQVEAMGVF